MSTQVNVTQCQVTTANANKDGSGAVVTAWTPAYRGSYLTKILVACPVTTAAAVVRLMWYDGTNTYLYKEIPVSAVTPSATVAGFAVDASPPIPEFYPAGWILKAATSVSQATNITVGGIDI